MNYLLIKKIEILSSNVYLIEIKPGIILHINIIATYECPYCGYKCKSQEINFDYEFN